MGLLPGVIVPVFIEFTGPQGVSQDSKTGRPKIFLGVAKYMRGHGRTKSVLGR